MRVELSSVQSALDEKTQRVTELEDTLKGTSLLVRQKVEAVLKYMYILH